MVVDDAFRIPGRARGVVERDRFPLVGGWRPGGARIAAREEVLVLDLAESLAAGPERIGEVDHRDAPPEDRQRLLDGRRELGVGEEHLRLRVLENERDRRRIQPVVERVEHGARHRHAEVRFVHRRRVGRHHRDRVAAADAEPAERRRQPARSLVDLGPGVALVAVHDRDVIGKRCRAARQERERRERNVVRRVLVEVVSYGFTGISTVTKGAAAGRRCGGPIVRGSIILNRHRSRPLHPRHKDPLPGPRGPLTPLLV